MDQGQELAAQRYALLSVATAPREPLPFAGVFVGGARIPARPPLPPLPGIAALLNRCVATSAA